MGRRQQTPEEREQAYQRRLEKAREYSRKVRAEKPELCRERVRKCYEKHEDHYRSIINESVKKYNKRKREIQQQLEQIVTV